MDVVPPRPMDLATVPLNVDEVDGIPVIAAAAPDPIPRVALNTGLVYSTVMMLHSFPTTSVKPSDDHPEAPERISRAFIVLKENGCVQRMKRIQPREITRDEVALVHQQGVWEGVYRSQFFSRAELVEMTTLFGERSSLYINEHTFLSARLSCGGVMELCDAVCSGQIRNGFAIVRPPGHHAEPDKSMGFCLFNNVAVAARWIREKYGGEDVPEEQRVRKILILDWDVHHGNGTQRAFEEDADILYISLHRYDDGEFYPCGTYGSSSSLGTGPGRGYSINIPWPCGDMGDGEYMYAFHQVVMPIAAEFGPDLVIISAGFDAARGDPLGGCDVTPIGYAQMTWMLMGLARGKVVVALEGGYNIEALALSALAVTRTLLGDPVPSHESLEPACSAAVDVLRLVKRDVSPYWKCIESSPLDPRPDLEEGLARYSLSELLKAHRQQEVARHYQLSELPTGEGGVGGGGGVDRKWESHALCSSDLMDTPRPIVLFAHDMGSLRAGNERPNLALVPESEGAYMIDTSKDVLDWVQKRGFGIVDVNLFAGSGSAASGGGGPDATDFLEFIWDTYLDLSPTPSILLLAHSSACKSVLSLITTRRLDKDPRVLATCFTMGHEPLPMVPRDEPELRKWYTRNGRVWLPESHSWWGMDEEKRRKMKRAGKVVEVVGERRPLQVLRAALGQVGEFVEGKLQAAGVAGAGIGAANAGEEVVMA